MNAAQQIIEQDNAQIQALIDALDKAEDARSEAYHTGQGIDLAEMAVAQASHNLTMALRSFWRTGYRLSRED